MIECPEKRQQHQQGYTQQQQQRHGFILPIQANSISLEDVDGLQQVNYHYQQSNREPTTQRSLNYSHQATLVDIQPTQLQRQQKVHQQAGNELIGYYFGSISRDTAEWILKNHGNHQDGAYLLRSSGPNDDFVLSLMVVCDENRQKYDVNNYKSSMLQEVLHYKIVETEDSFVALHGQVGDEKFSTIDELIEKAQGVATKPRWPILRLSLETQILPPTYWGLTIDQVRLAILIKAKQWGFPLFSSLFQQSNANASPSMDQSSAIQMLDLTATDINGSGGGTLTNNVTTLSNETIRTLIYKSLHEFQPWFHGKISREEAERRVEKEGRPRDGRFLVRERDNYSYAMCISHKKTTKHYRIDVLPTGELAIQDGHKFTSLMALVSHYTLMSDGLWCALTEACPRPIQRNPVNNINMTRNSSLINASNNLYCVPPPPSTIYPHGNHHLPMSQLQQQQSAMLTNSNQLSNTGQGKQVSNDPEQSNLMCPNQNVKSMSIKAPIKEWLQTINQKWSQFMEAKNQQSLNSFLFSSSNPLNNHCSKNNRHHHHHHQSRSTQRDRQCKTSTCSASCRSHTSTTLQTKRIPGQLSCKSSIDTSKSSVPVRSNALLSQIKMPSCSCCQIPTTNVNEQSLTMRQGMGNYARGCCINGPEFSKAQEQLNPSAQCSGLNLTKSLLTCLPQNSGFTLNSQSFIGSPLFAVRHSLTNACPNVSTQQDTGRGSSSGSGEIAREEKLISPAQSISANLNIGPYNMDIYGSQTSTAIVNDRVPTNSSSSSSASKPLAQTNNSANRYNLNKNPMKYLKSNSCSIENSNTFAPQLRQQVHEIAASNDQQPDQIQQPPRPTILSGTVQQAGPILCGQHAGPAFRYTNFQADDNTINSCAHLRQMNRATDDLHVQIPSTQLASAAAALSKFVQFQDGQCLRTHRDTRSIQMAYLLSRQQQHAQQLKANQMSSYQQSSQISQNPSQTIMSNKSDANFFNQIPNNDGNSITKTSNQVADDFNLMDCDNDVFQFKYDPKLIKSSSIETLCGGNDDENENDFLDDLRNFKTNSELVMSLQSYRPSARNPVNDILSPIPATLKQNQPDSNEGCASETCLQNLSYLPVSSMHETPKNMFNEDLYSSKKKHDLDELTTSLLAELTTSLKAQIDLKNKRSGLASASTEPNAKVEEQLPQSDQKCSNSVTNPTDLVNEFDSLKK